MISHQNYASDTQFFAQFIIKDETLKYYLQEVQLPSVDFGQIDINKKGVVLPKIGDSRSNGSISLNFILDEDYTVYTELLDIQEHIRLDLKSLNQFQVFIQNNQNVTILEIVFEDIFFTNVTGPTLSTKSQMTEIFVDTTMQYSNFKIKRKN